MPKNHTAAVPLFPLGGIMRARDALAAHVVSRGRVCARK